MSERGLCETIVGCFRQVLSSPSGKGTGKNIRYGMEDAALSAFSVFFTQTPSFLAYQRMMQGSKGENNAKVCLKRIRFRLTSTFGICSTR